MVLEDIKSAIRELSLEDRRKVALFILDLEKQHFQGTVGPQLVEDLNAFTRVVQEAVEKIKKHVEKNF
jgi:class 3 adenylate cyclase